MESIKDKQIENLSKKENEAFRTLPILIHSSVALAALSGGLYVAHKKQMSILGYAAIGTGSLIAGLLGGILAARAVDSKYFKLEWY